MINNSDHDCICVYIYCPPKVWKRPRKVGFWTIITLPRHTSKLDPKHTSKLCKSYLERKQSAGIMSVMEWPPQSPDLNPIELLGTGTVDVRKKWSNQCESSLVILQEAWSNISSHCLNKLTARMPRLCRAVIAANGRFF